MNIHDPAEHASMSISKSMHIRRAPEDAFRLFVDEIGKWWPFETGRYTYGGDRAQDIYLEAHVGGRLYERFKDGEEFVIGQVTACERPNRIEFTWRGTGDDPTEVEVRFDPSGDGTLVSLEHRGVEKLGPQSAAWDAGWDEVLSSYSRAA